MSNVNLGIGEALREARMRAKIDISEVEAETKIRAKYLRALENEEWNLLPGSTYIKSFLRTYARFLGLDETLLVNEYRSRFDNPTEVEMRPMTLGGGQSGVRKKPARISRGAVVLVIVIGLITVLGILGATGGKDSSQFENKPVAQENKEAQINAQKQEQKERQAALAKKEKKKVNLKLEIKQTSQVWVCLQNNQGKILIIGEVLQPNSKKLSFRGKNFKLGLGNGHMEIKLNGKQQKIPPVTGPINYRITTKGVSELSSNKRPNCG